MSSYLWKKYIYNDSRYYNLPSSAYKGYDAYLAGETFSCKQYYIYYSKIRSIKESDQMINIQKHNKYLKLLIYE